MWLVKLLNNVKCLDGIKGYHHSWLGDELFVANKLQSYAHFRLSFCKIFDKNGNVDINIIKEHIRSGKPYSLVYR